MRPPEARDVAAVATRVAALLESQNEESLEQKEPGLAALAGASIVGRVAEGPNAGQRVKTAGIDTRERDLEESFETANSRCALVSGFSVHTGVRIWAGHRKELERLCRYAARPPLAIDRCRNWPTAA